MFLFCFRPFTRVYMGKFSITMTNYYQSLFQFFSLIVNTRKVKLYSSRYTYKHRKNSPKVGTITSLCRCFLLQYTRYNRFGLQIFFETIVIYIQVKCAEIIIVAVQYIILDRNKKCILHRCTPRSQS